MTPEEILARALSGPVRLTFASQADAHTYRFRLYGARDRFRDQRVKKGDGLWASPWDGLGVFCEDCILTVRPRVPTLGQPLKIETEASREPV